MKLSVTVERGGEESLIKCSPLAFIGWERETKRRLSDLQDGGLGMTDLAILAWIQERTQGTTDAETVDAYLEGVDDLNPVVEDPPPGDEGA